MRCKSTKEILKRFDCLDLSLFKLSVAAFTLFLAKIWSPLLGLTWQMYFALGVLAAARPVYKAYFK